MARFLTFFDFVYNRSYADTTLSTITVFVFYSCIIFIDSAPSYSRTWKFIATLLVLGNSIRIIATYFYLGEAYFLTRIFCNGETCYNFANEAIKGLIDLAIFAARYCFLAAFDTNRFMLLRQHLRVRRIKILETSKMNSVLVKPSNAWTAPVIYA